MKNECKPCRYLEEVEGGPYCAYYDNVLKTIEVHKCFLGGWECYECPNGEVYDGSWMGLSDFLDTQQKKLPDNLETHLPDKYSGDVLVELLGWDEDDRPA